MFLTPHTYTHTHIHAYTTVMKNSRDSSYAEWEDQITPPPFKRSKSSFTVRLAQDTTMSHRKKNTGEQPTFFPHPKLSGDNNNVRRKGFRRGDSSNSGTFSESPEHSATKQGVDSLVNLFRSEYTYLSGLTTERSSQSANEAAIRLGASAQQDIPAVPYAPLSQHLYTATTTTSTTSSSQPPKFQWISEPKKVTPAIPNVRGVLPEIGCFWAQDNAELLLSSCADSTRSNETARPARAPSAPTASTKLQFSAEITRLVCGRPLPRVFRAEYEWVLVAVTDAAVSILLYSPARRHVDDTGLSAAVPAGVSVTAAAVMPNGRAFLGGSDGHIYELRYRKQPCVAQLRRVTGGLLSDLGRRLLRVPADPVAQLAVDGARGLLYCLRDRSSDVEAYGVGSPRGGGFALVGAARRLYRRVCSYLREYLFHKDVFPGQEVLDSLVSDEGALGKRLWGNVCSKYFPRFVVSIHPLPHNTVGLVAVTAQGAFLHFAPPASRTLELTNVDLNGRADRLVSVSAAACAGSTLLTAAVRVPTNQPQAGPAAAISCAASVVPGSAFFSTQSLVPQPPDVAAVARAIIPMGCMQLYPATATTPFTLAMPGPPPPHAVAQVLSFRKGFGSLEWEGEGQQEEQEGGDNGWLSALLRWWNGSRRSQRSKRRFPDAGIVKEAADLPRLVAGGKRAGKEFYAGFSTEIRSPRYSQYMSCEAVSQLFVPPQTFLVEYAEADGPQFYALTRQRPLEVFRRVMLDTAELRSSEENERFRAFIGAFAPEEIYIMSIALYSIFASSSLSASSPSSSSSSSTALFGSTEDDDDDDNNEGNNAKVAHYAKKIFLGQIRIDHILRGSRGGSGSARNFDPKDSEDAFREHRFVGVCTFLSRVLQPLLASALCDPQNPAALAWHPEDVRSTLGYLQRAHELLAQAPAALYPAAKYASFVPQVLCVLERACDALAFMGVLAEGGVFARAVRLLDNSLQRELPAAQFYDLIRGNPGENTLLLTLLAAAMEALEQGGADGLRALLAKRCPAFLPHAELARFRGVQLLAQARACSDAVQARTLLRDSLAEFLKVPGQLGIDVICHAYTAEGFYEGVVRLALQAAEDADRASPAAASLLLDANAKQQQQQNVSLSQPLFPGAMGLRESPYDLQKDITDYKERCYRHVLRLFSTLRVGISPAGLNTAKLVSRDPTAVDPAEVRRLVALALSYKCRLWHRRLYEWYVANGLENELLDIDSPYILEFLQSRDAELNLVWRYHARHGRHDEAARALYANVMNGGARTPIEQKIELLATAAGMLKAPGLAGSALERSVRGALGTLVYQRHVLAELTARGGSTGNGGRGLEDLRTKPMSMDELVDIARRHRLHALIIEGMRIRGDRDESAVRDAYADLIHSWGNAGDQSVSVLAAALGDLARQALSSEQDKLPSSSSSSFYFPRDFVMRELVALGDPRLEMEPVLRALIEAGVSYMDLFFTLSEMYNDAASFQDGYGDFIMEYARDDRKLTELKDAIAFVVGEMARALCSGSDTRCTERDMEQVKEFITRISDESLSSLLGDIEKARSQRY